ncbi:MAG: hypothetical protein R2771_04110 [Saprospiraceae bacterium]
MKRLYLIIIALVFSLFIYLFFRPDDTVVSRLFIKIFSLDFYHSLKYEVQNLFHFSNFVIYSLPGGLWVFSTALIAKDMKFKLWGTTIMLIYFPLMYALGLELLQYFHITDGTFDIDDILISLLAWVLVFKYYNTNTSKCILNPRLTTMIFIINFAILYLADIWK